MKSNRVKRILCVAMTLALALALMPAALAEGDAQLFIEGGDVSGNVLQVVFYSDAAETPSLENLSAQIDGQAVTLKSVNPLSYADPGTSYVLLFDTNTAVTGRALPDMQKIARALVGGMGTADNMLISALGGDMSVKDFLDNPDEINGKIDALTAGTEPQDLYSSMYDALKLLSETEGLRARKCLVVMADGLDNQLAGVSEMELSSLVEKAQVPICVVALTYNTNTDERIAAAKTITGFARLSPAGLYINLKSNGAEDAAKQILARKDKTYLAVMESDAVRAVTQADKADFTLALTTASAALTAERTISLGGLKGAPVTPEPSAEVTPIPTATLMPVPTSGLDGLLNKIKTLPIWVYAAAGGGLLLIIALIVVLAVLGKKRRSPKGAQGTIVRFDPTSEELDGADAPELCIIRLGKEEQICCEMRMPSKLVIGGDPRRAQLALSGDPSLSPAQCRLIWRNGVVFVEEMSKKHRTLLNGAAVEETTAVRPGDVLRLGAMDYRVFWENK